jgi:hypothetical protein
MVLAKLGNARSASGFSLPSISNERFPLGYLFEH